MRVKGLYQEVVSAIPPEIKKQTDYSFAVSDKIDARMKELGLSVNDLAKRIGVKPITVKIWLGGTHNFTIKTLAKISVALEMDLITI